MDARLAKIKKHKLDHGKEMNNDEEIKVDIAGFDFNSGAEQKSVASDEGMCSVGQLTCWCITNCTSHY